MGFFCGLAGLRPFIWQGDSQHSWEFVGSRVTLKKKKKIAKITSKCFWSGSFPPKSNSRIQTASTLWCCYMTYDLQVYWRREGAVGILTFYRLCLKGVYIPGLALHWWELIKCSHLETRRLENASVGSHFPKWFYTEEKQHESLVVTIYCKGLD